MSRRNLIVNRDKPPFDNPEIRRALALSLDRKAFIDTINEGKADIGGAMLPPPEGIWGMPPEMLRSLPGYDPDVAKNRSEARKIMEEHGYGPEQAAQYHSVDAQHPAISRSCGHPDRSIKADLHRRQISKRSIPSIGIQRSCAKTSP